MKKYFTAGGRKHFRGKNPCGYCQSGSHKDCRPRLDGTLCTCTCERAKVARAEFERKSNAALAVGSVQPTVKEALEILHPRWEQEFETDF